MRPNFAYRFRAASTRWQKSPSEVLEDRVLLAAPLANDDAVVTNEDAELHGDLFADNGSGADSDPDADPISVAAVNGNTAAVDQPIPLASGSILTVLSNGSLTYKPSSAFGSLTLGQTATDEFTYRISDGTAPSRTATVTVTIVGVNTQPIANSDTFSISKFTLLRGDLLANDSDPDRHSLTITKVNGSAAAVGTQITLASGSVLTVRSGGAFTYEAGGRLKRLEIGEMGTDQFSYAVSDGHGGTGAASVIIRVSGQGVDDLVAYHQGTWQIGRSTGSAFATSTTLSTVTDWDALAYGDFNADGLTDVVALVDGRWQVGISNGSGFTFAEWARWSNAAWKDVTAGDLNGDGRDDVLARIGGAWWVALSNGAGFGTASRWATWSNQSWRNVILTDLNNDGQADLLTQLHGAWWAALSNGTNAFTSVTRWAKWADIDWDALGTADFNNDGRTDIYGLIDGAWYVGQSGGASFNTLLRTVWANVAWKDVRIGDFNGDGRDDLTARIGGAWWISYSDAGLGGRGGATTSWVTWSDLAWRDVTVGDFDGDGRDDIAGRYVGEWWVSRTGSSAVVTSRWDTWSDVAWERVTAADFDGSSPQSQFSSRTASGALWAQLAEDKEFAARLLAS